MNKIISNLIKWIVFLCIIIGLYVISGSSAQPIDKNIKIVQNVQDTNTFKKESQSRQLEQRANNEELKKQLKSIKKDTIN